MDRALCGITRPEDVGLSSAGLDAVDAAIGSYVENGTLAGAVTLVARSGRIARVTTLGMKDLENGEPMAMDTIFRIFSMTKPVTGTAMMILHDEGKWKADDPIAWHLPELEGLKVFAGLDAAGKPLLEEPDHAPTIGELMTHMAGFAYGTAFGDPNDVVDTLYREAGVLQSRDLDDMVGKLARLPLAYQPGSRLRYSLSMDLQGAIIERLSGQSLPDFARTRIFEPLGMADTAFHTPAEKQARLASLYFKAGDMPLAELDNPLGKDYSEPPALALGGAGLFSTVGDYARFAQMLLNRGELDGIRIVSAQGIAEQMTNRLADDLLETRFVVGHHKFRPGFGYGYNGVVFTDPDLAGLPVGKGTYHWDGAAGTWFWVDPQNDLLFVGMIQLLSFTAPPLQELTQRLIADAMIA
jgi:CubicO group peptidase (beta-lactamase class C family)